MFSYQDLMKPAQDPTKLFLPLFTSNYQLYQYYIDMYAKSVDLTIKWTNDVVKAKVKLAQTATDTLTTTFKSVV